MDPFEWDSPAYSAYKDWSEAENALIQILPKTPEARKKTFRVVSEIQRRFNALLERPSASQVAYWHDTDGLNLSEISGKVEDRRAEAEVWSWAAVAVLRNHAPDSKKGDFQIPLPDHPRSLALAHGVIQAIPELFFTLGGTKK